MKKLVNLKGVKTLNKNEQKSISGGSCHGCTQQGGQCCITFGNGFELCEPGNCINGSCLWF